MRLILPLCTLLVVILAGCGGSTAPPHHPSNTLSWGVAGVSDVPTLDPALASDPTSISVASMIYGGLVRLDAHLHVQPDGATHWAISPDGRTYTFYLRPNLRYPDGRRATATDFAASLDRALGPEGESGIGPVYLSLIAHGTGTNTSKPAVKVINATTLQIRLVHPAAHFLSELAFPVSFVPDPAVLQRYGASWTDHAAGFGPYYVKSWEHSQSLTLVRNRHYFGKRPPLHTITIRFYPTPSAGIRAYRSGRIDLLSGLQPGQAISAPPGGTQRVPALAMDYLAFNISRNPFQSLDVRRAFAAVWSPSLVKTTMGMTAFPAHSFLPSAFGLTVPTWAPKKTPAQLMAAAHVRGGEHFPQIVLLLPDDPNLHRLGTALAARWRKALGVTVFLRSLNS